MSQVTLDKVKRKSAAGTVASVRESIESSACETCGHVNLTARRFCSGCGRSLWNVCPGCGAEGPVGDAFCGTCGASLSELQRRQTDRHRATLQEARRLLADHRYEDAKWRLQELVKLGSEQDRSVSQEGGPLT